MKVAQIGIEKIRFHVICAVHTVVKKIRSEQKNWIWVTFDCSLNVALVSLRKLLKHTEERLPANFEKKKSCKRSLI